MKRGIEQEQQQQQRKIAPFSAVLYITNISRLVLLVSIYSMCVAICHWQENF